MAALTYSGSFTPRRSLRVLPPDAHLRRIDGASPRSFPTPVGTGTPIVSLVERKRRRAAIARRRRLLSYLVSAAILAATWGIGGALAGLHASRIAVLPGTVHTSGGYLYTVRSGDTVWSIATQLDPSGDPRPLVAQIDAHLAGTAIYPGERILVP